MARLLARLRPYGLALLCTAGAVVTRWLLDPLLHDDLPFVTAFAFAALAVWLVGWAPALFMAVTSYLAVRWFFVEPRHELVLNWSFFWYLFAYTVGVVPVIAIGEAMRRSRKRERLQSTLTKEKQLTLEESEERYRSLVSVITDVPWTTDANGEFVVPQPAWEAYTGQSWEEHRGSGWVQALHPEDRDRVNELWLAACRARTRYESRGRLWHAPSRQWRYYVGRATPLFHQDGSVRAWVGAATDVDDIMRVTHALRESEARLQSFAQELERKVAERTEELVRSQEQLRAMAADLTLAEQRERQRFATELHDHLQQMLVFCKLKLGRAKKLGPGAPEMPVLMAEIDETLTRALTYSRSLVSELSPPVLRELGFASALNWLGEWMTSLDLDVTVETGEQQGIELPEAHAVLMFQSVRELLINAAKYAGTGRATVRLERSDGHLTVTVSDEGRGFDPAAAKTTRAASSAGFGLFSIRERMKTLGGSMQLESAPGTGTRATLSLPFVPQPVRSARAAGPSLDERKVASRGGARSGVVSVLLVDDHAVVREGLRTVLSEHDDLDVVGEATDGEDAVACVQRLRPAVVVMDINMPRKNGIAATAEITARWPEIVVIGLSVNADRENQEAMKRAGAAVLLPKEAAVNDLYRSIQSVLNR